MKASHKKVWIPVSTGIGFTQVELEPGQFIFGRFEAAKELKMKSSSVRNRIEKLKNIKNLDIRPDTHFSIISVLNWDTYQSAEDLNEQALGQPEDTHRTGTGQPQDTYKNVKNEKNVKKLNILPVKEFIDFYFEEFKTKFGNPPIIQGAKDGSIVKALLKTIPIEELKSLLERFFDSYDPFILKSGYTLGVFKSQINKLRIGTVEKLSPGDMWLMASQEKDRLEEEYGKKGQAPLQIGNRENGPDPTQSES